MAPAVIVLAIMVLPTVAAISQDAFTLIPYKVKEAAYGMGTTRWEAILKVMLPTAASGIFASLVLGFGRALGETMALAMLIGNSNQISLSLFSPANTLASLLASQFPEAAAVEVQALMYAALVLLAITLVVNVAGTLIMALVRAAEGDLTWRRSTAHRRVPAVGVPDLRRSFTDRRSLRNSVLTVLLWMVALLGGGAAGLGALHADRPGAARGSGSSSSPAAAGGLRARAAASATPSSAPW